MISLLVVRIFIIETCKFTSITYYLLYTKMTRRGPLAAILRTVIYNPLNYYTYSFSKL